MPPGPLPPIVLYERSGCHLCESARADLESLLASWAVEGRDVPELIGRDIDTDPAWHDAFFETIPVVEVADRRLPLATSPARVRRFIEEALAAETRSIGQVSR
ncbi:MAG TPA: glutaredoxin family protein [Candidatus Dormibacteraeota bacterium]|nr:glutaredoxin family protein [Candidatus Dormibacteraeota bacterium]